MRAMAMTVPRNMFLLFRDGQVGKSEAVPRSLGGEVPARWRGATPVRVRRVRAAARHCSLPMVTVMRVADLADVNTVVEVAAEGNRKLVEQQVLCGKFGVFGHPVEGRVITVHVFVEALHDIRKGLDVCHFRLGAVPYGECVDFVQVAGIGDASFATGVQGIFQVFHAGQIVDDEVRIAPKFITLIQILQPVVRQLDAGDTRRQDE